MDVDVKLAFCGVPKTDKPKCNKLSSGVSQGDEIEATRSRTLGYKVI